MPKIQYTDNRQICRQSVLWSMTANVVQRLQMWVLPRRFQDSQPFISSWLLHLQTGWKLGQGSQWLTANAEQPHTRQCRLLEAVLAAGYWKQQQLPGSRLFSAPLGDHLPQKAGARGRWAAAGLHWQQNLPECEAVRLCCLPWPQAGAILCTLASAGSPHWHAAKLKSLCTEGFCSGLTKLSMTKCYRSTSQDNGLDVERKWYRVLVCQVACTPLQAALFLTPCWSRFF